MARVTRSKKIDIAEDQIALAVQTPLPDTPGQGPFVELPKESNIMPSVQEDEVSTEVKGLKAAYRTAIGLGKKGKKGKGKKKNNQESVELSRGSNTDEIAHSAEPPINKKCKMTADKEEASTGQLMIDDHVKPSDNGQCSEATVEEHKKPTGRATRATRQQLAKAQAADEAAQNIAALDAHSTNETSTEVGLIGRNEAPPVYTPEAPIESKSLIEEKRTRTISQSPTKSGTKTLEEVESAFATEGPAGVVDDDSFVDQIICRSPAKPVSRIEDSVEALDQLEDALEAIDEAASAERIVPTAQMAKENTKTGVSREEKSVTSAKPTKQPTNPKHSTVRIKSTQPRTTILQRSASTSKSPSSNLYKALAPHLAIEQVKTIEAEKAKKAPSKRPISLLAPKEPVKSTKPLTRPAKFELPGEAIARKLKEQREARQAQRDSSEDTVRAGLGPGPRIKSSKPTTKSTFELPGEVISRKKREAHEARLKAQEEEERKRREFKAKPLRKSIVPNVVPRDTAASRARQSKIGLESMDVSSLSVAKRGSNVGAHRPSIAQITLANMSAPRSPGPPPLERKVSVKASGPSMSGLAMQRTVSSSDVHAQRQRAREIYNRDNKLTEEIEREKREREAAAKRSREEAAERGRQASREWAEKMRAKKMAEGDKGMGIGYGPGGQMGLRG